MLPKRDQRVRNDATDQTLNEQPASEENWVEQQPSRSRATEGLSLDLARMLETLDEEDRALLIMKYAEGHEYEELAEIFGASVSACKMRISRAREKLKLMYPDETH